MPLYPAFWGGVVPNPTNFSSQVVIADGFGNGIAGDGDGDGATYILGSNATDPTATTLICQGGQSTSAAGGDFQARGGQTTATGMQGGQVFLQGGSGLGAATIVNPGPVTINGGEAVDNGGGNNANGGQVNINGGVADSAGNGGSILLKGGTSGTGIPGQIQSTSLLSLNPIMVNDAIASNMGAVIVDEYVMDAVNELIFIDPSEMVVI